MVNPWQVREVRAEEEVVSHADEVRELTKQLEHAINKRDQWADRIAGLRQSLQVATRKQREVTVNERRLELACVVAEWDDKSAKESGRWSPRWWSSQGWAEVAKEVETSNLGAVVAVFAELDPRRQYVLEHYHGLGVKKRSMAAIGASLPRDREWLHGNWEAYGVSATQVRQLLYNSYRFLRNTVNERDFVLCGRRETWYRMKSKPFLSQVFRHGGLGKDTPQETP